jgi:formylglycine-generating enzyme required for sulfatase activity
MYPANRFGLFDMHGNVWEWCQDWSQDNYYASSPASDPTGPMRGEKRILRGGAFDCPGSIACQHHAMTASLQNEPATSDFAWWPKLGGY